MHDDAKPSCSINLRKGLWTCFVGCGGGSLRTLFKELGYSRIEIDGKLRKAFDVGEVEFIDPFRQNDGDSGELESDLPIVTIAYDDSRCPNFIRDRGFTKELLRKWEMGLDPRYGGLVIPVRDIKGRLVGSITRARPGNNHVPKYLYSKGLKKSKVLFGAYNIDKKPNILCITEGSLDTLWLDQNGYPAVALLGLSMSKRQQQLILSLHPQEVVLCLDNDDPGLAAAEHIAQRLSSHVPVTFIRLPNGVKDVQDVKDPELLNKIIDNRSIVQA